MNFTKKLLSVLEKYRRVLSWHILQSQDDLKMKSFVEVIFYILVFSVLLFIYNCWNEVPVRKIVVVAEYDNSNSKTDNDTLFKSSDIFLRIPMTNTSLDSTGLFEAAISLNKTYKRKDSVYDKTIDSSTLNKETQILCKNLEYNYKERDSISNIYPIFKNSDILYFAYGFSRNPLNSKERDDEFLYDPSEIVFEHIKQTRNLVSRLTYTPNGKKIYSTIQYGALTSPPWYRFEDISQSYFNIILNTKSIDSLTLKIDFVGVAEFSHMIPEPDVQGMGYIQYHNPEKIQTIKKSGLLFHAKFKELENKQTVRLFFVTTVLGGIVIIGTAILFVAIYRVALWSKRNKVKGFVLLICVILVLLLYFNVINVSYLFEK